MARGDLILRIGADDGPIRATLKKLNNTLVTTGKKLESIGSSLSLRLSAPIVGAGVAAVGAFAKFEKFEKSLLAVSGSAQEAEATLSRLRKLALQPGIDLENAVTGSIRLQAVGFAAKQAEDLILQFSKAVTLAGGSGEDLGEVVRQITQIISKGKLLSSDFRVIQERVPAIGIALQKAFGTTNIEQIREAGVSASDFVSRLTEGIRTSKEFQNVQGGLANSFNNFQQAIQGSLVTLGRTISETINLEGILDVLASTISNIVEGFSRLSPTTKTIILVVAGLAAAIGPLTFAIGSLIQALPLLTAGFTALTGPIGLVALAIGALGAIMLYDYLNVVDQAAVKQQTLNDLLKDASRLADEESRKVSSLVDIIRDEAATRGEKARAIEELKRINPGYFGDLDIEKTKLEDLLDISEKYNASLQVGKAIKLANERSEAAQKELEAARETLEIIELQRNAPGNFGTGAVFSIPEKEVKNRIKRLEAEIQGFAAALQQELNTFNEGLSGDSIKGNESKNKEFGKSIVSGVSEGIKEEIKKTAEIGSGLGGFGDTSQFTAFAETVRDNLDLVGEAFVSTRDKAAQSLGIIGGNIDEFKERLEVLPTFVNQYNDSIAKVDEKQKALGSTFDSLSEKISLTRSALEVAAEQYGAASSEVAFYQEKLNGLIATQERQIELQENLAKIQAVASSAFNAAADSQEKGLKGLTKAFKSAARDFIKAQLSQAVASQVKNIIATVPFPFNIALATAGAAAVGALFSKIIPAFGTGAEVNSPTLALIGERGPEYVVPKTDMKNLLESRFPGGGGYGELVARIDGEELLFFLNRIENNVNRIG